MPNTVVYSIIIATVVVLLAIICGAAVSGANQYHNDHDQYAKIDPVYAQYLKCVRATSDEAFCRGELGFKS